VDVDTVSPFGAEDGDLPDFLLPLEDGEVEVFVLALPFLEEVHGLLQVTVEGEESLPDPIE